MAKFVELLPVDNVGAMTTQYGNFEHRVRNYHKIIGILPAPAASMNFSLSINDGESVVVGGFSTEIIKKKPDGRVLSINKNVNYNDLVRISIRQSTAKDGFGLASASRIYLLVE